MYNQGFKNVSCNHPAVWIRQMLDAGRITQKEKDFSKNKFS